MERIPILKMGEFLLVSIQVDMHDQLVMALQDDLTDRVVKTRARGVLIGRAWVYALGARGSAGVTHVLELLAAEMKVAMALTGNTAVKSIGGDSIASLATQSGRR